MRTRHAQVGGMEARTSPITERTILVNDTYDLVLVEKDADIHRCGEWWTEHKTCWMRAGNMRTLRHRSKDWDIDAWGERFGKAEDTHEMAQAIDGMLAVQKGKKRGRGYTRFCLMWLTRLWAEGVCTIPPNGRRR